MHCEWTCPQTTLNSISGDKNDNTDLRSGITSITKGFSGWYMQHFGDSCPGELFGWWSDLSSSLKVIRNGTIGSRI